MRRASSILSDLIVLAEEVIIRPNMADPRLSTRARDLAAEVRHLDGRPAEGIRCTSAAMIMVIAIEQMRAVSPIPVAQWQMIAGASLPLLRDAAFVAFQEERGWQS